MPAALNNPSHGNPLLSKKTYIQSAHGPHSSFGTMEEETIAIKKPQPNDPPLSRLTSRQIDVLKLIALGHTTKEIASQLQLSVKSIDSHKYRLMKKLGIHDRVHLCRYAIRQGLIEP
ncbi:MAG: hypothetical protein Tsb009_12220 [Planctomycetaceae bacterium]